MEDYLKKFRAARPPADFAERVLAKARAHADETWSGRLWGSKRFWASAAAILLVCFAMNRMDGPVVQAPTRAEAPASEFVREIAEMLGDGEALEARLRVQLNTRRLTGSGDETTSRHMWRELEWPS